MLKATEERRRRRRSFSLLPLQVGRFFKAAEGTKEGKRRRRRGGGGERLEGRGGASFSPSLSLFPPSVPPRSLRTVTVNI